MNQSFDLSTIVFAALAIFIVWKLRSVLGTRTGEERPPFNPFVRRNAGKVEENATAPETGKVIPLPGSSIGTAPAADADRWKGFAEPGATLAAALDRIAAADRSFAAKSFVEGARAAYEMILAAFAKGDRKSLSGLLAKDVYDGFVTAIADRETRGETIEHTFVSLDSAKIKDAQLIGQSAQITMLFESHQINATRTSGGALAETGTEAVSPVIDHWTFARTLTAADPNWTLVATHAE